MVHRDILSVPETGAMTSESVAQRIYDRRVFAPGLSRV
jgi:hypothetical protein